MSIQGTKEVEITPRHESAIISVLSSAASCVPTSIETKQPKDYDFIDVSVNLCPRPEYQGPFHATSLSGAVMAFPTNLSHTHPVFKGNPRELPHHVPVFENSASILSTDLLATPQQVLAEITTGTPMYPTMMKKLIESWHMPEIVSNMILLHSDAISNCVIAPPLTDANSLAVIAMYRTIIEDREMRKVIDDCITDRWLSPTLDLVAKKSREELLKTFLVKVSIKDFSSKITRKMEDLVSPTKGLSGWLSQQSEAVYANEVREQLFQELLACASVDLQNASEGFKLWLREFRQARNC